MEKRTSKEIEKDLEIIKANSKNAKTWKELAELSGLTVPKIRVTLSSHPIVKNRIAKQLEENKEEITIKDLSKEDIVISETSALMEGLQSCLSTPIILPHFVVAELEKLATNNINAQKALLAIHLTRDWVSYGPNLYSKEVLNKEPEFFIKFRSRGIVALACYYWNEGYRNITIKTRSSEVALLAKIQQSGFIVDFVDTDENLLKKAK